MARLKILGNAKVNQAQAAVFVQHDIGRLHVAEDDRRVAIVQELQDIAQLNRPFQHLLLRQEARHLAEHGFQIAPFDEFHDQIGASFFAEVVIYFRNGRMAQRRQNVGFALKILHGDLPHLRIQRMALHFLHRAQFHHAGEAPIAPLIHGAHAAEPQDAHDLIAILQDTAWR